MAQKDIIFRLKVEGAGNTQSLLAQTTKEIDKLEKELKQAEAGTDKFLQAQRRLAQFQSTLKTRGSEFSAQLKRSNQLQSQATTRANTTTKSVGGLSDAFGVATKAAAALIALQIAQKVAEIGKAAILAAGEYENLSVAFDTFLGGADKAAQVLADLNKFSVETPFTPEQINSAAKQLLAFNFGVGETQKLLRITGNIAAGTGTNFNELAELIGKARVQGRLYQEDINQFSGRGVNIVGELAKQFKVTESEVRKLVETGRVGYPQLEKALTSLATENGKFTGLIEKQAKTLPGLLSTLEGSWNNLLRVFGEGELLNSAKKGVNSLITTINGLSDAINPQTKIIQASVNDLKKELSLENLSGLTKTELASRQSVIEAALSEEKQALEVNADAQRIFFNAEKALNKAKREEAGFLEGIGLSAFESLKELNEDGTAATSTEQIKQRKLVEDTQRARIASLEIALDDIKKIEVNASKEVQARIASEATDFLKLQIFRLELVKSGAIGRQEAAIRSATVDIEAIDTIKEAEIELSNLRLILANKSAKNQKAKTLNREKQEEKTAKNIKENEDLLLKSADAVNEELLKVRPIISGTISEIVNADLAAEFDAWAKGGSLINTEFKKVNETAVKLASTFDTLLDGIKFTFEEIAPIALDLFSQVNAAQEAALDRALTIQQDRVNQAKDIAEKGNADVLAAERKRLAEIQDARERAARRGELLAKAETRIQIGLAVARAVATDASRLGFAALATGAAVAIGLPALINAIPVFEDGGEIGGKAHSQGGTMINAEKGEFVTNKKDTSRFMPALKAINGSKASPELVNAAATGNLTQIFDMHTRPMIDRLSDIEKAIQGIPQTDLLVNERGFTKRVSRFQKLNNRIVK